MKTSYATMVGAICLDKGTDGDGIPAPVTFSVRKVMNGSQPWMQGNGNMTLSRGHASLQDAVRELHSKFILWLNDERSLGRESSFWMENYQGLRSKWQSWLKKQRHSFRYDNYQICIVTSNGDLVW